MTAAAIVGEKLTVITATSTTMTSRVHPVASGAIGSHGHTTQATTPMPTIATPRIVAVSLHDGDEMPPEPFDVERQAGDERDERRGDAGDDLHLSRHRLGDHVAEVRPDEDAEKEIPGQARQLQAAQHVASHPCAEQREADRQRDACGSGRRCRPEAAGPDHRRDDERDRRDSPHARRSRARRSAHSSWDTIVPSATMLNSGSA